MDVAAVVAEAVALVSVYAPLLDDASYGDDDAFQMVTVGVVAEVVAS